MPCLISDFALTLNSAGQEVPVSQSSSVPTGLHEAVRAWPDSVPFYYNDGSKTVEILRLATISATPDATTGAYSLSLPHPSESVPTTAKWYIRTWDGFTYYGAVPATNGPFTIRQLLDSQGWKLVNPSATAPVTTVTGPQGPQGPAGATGAQIAESDGAVPFNTTNGGLGTTDVSSFDSSVHIYVQSAYNTLDPNNAHASLGNDAQADPTAATRPLATYHGFLKYVRRAIWGRKVIAHFMADAPGGDPDACTETRAYLTREILVGASESYRATIQYRGPRKMCPIISGLTFTGGAGADPMNSTMNFSGTPFGTPQRAFLRITQSDNREWCFPLPIRKNTINSLTFDALLTGADFNTIPGGSTFKVVTPGALFIGDNGPPAGPGEGILIHGDCPVSVGDRILTSTIDPLTTYEAQFERVWPVRMNVNVTGEVGFDNCLLDDIPRIYHGTVGFHNCLAIQALWFIGGESRVPVAINQYSLTLEACGRPLATGGSADPVIQASGTDLVIYGSLILGHAYHGGPGARFRVHKGLSIAPRGGPGGQDGTGGIVINNDSTLYITDNACFYNNFGGVPGIWNKSGKARVNSTQLATGGGGGRMLFEKPGAEKDLVVSRGVVAGINLGTGAGQFRDASSYNGHYTLRNHVTNGQCDETDAVIYDKSWDENASFNDGT